MGHAKKSALWRTVSIKTYLGGRMIASMSVSYPLEMSMVDMC